MILRNNALLTCFFKIGIYFNVEVEKLKNTWHLVESSCILLVRLLVRWTQDAYYPVSSKQKTALNTDVGKHIFSD